MGYTCFFKDSVVPEEYPRVKLIKIGSKDSVTPPDILTMVKDEPILSPRTPLMIKGVSRRNSTIRFVKTNTDSPGSSQRGSRVYIDSPGSSQRGSSSLYIESLTSSLRG